MNTIRPTLPTLTVNRRFMVDFIAKEPPCLAIGLVEVEGNQCAMITLRLNEALPREISAGGFAFGHALYGGGRSSWEVVHFGFYGFATWHVLINPSDPVARLVLSTMIRTGDYFFFTLDSDHSTTAFRSDVAPDNLIWLKANMARIQASTTTDAEYRQAVSSFARRPNPPGTMLTWVCRNNADISDLVEDTLTPRPPEVVAETGLAASQQVGRYPAKWGGIPNGDADSRSRHFGPIWVIDILRR